MYVSYIFKKDSWLFMEYTLDTTKKNSLCFGVYEYILFYMLKIKGQNINSNRIKKTP